MKIKILVLVAMLGFVGIANASFRTVNEVLADCESENELTQNYCMFYLAGVMDAATIFMEWGNLSKEICIPHSDVTLEQMRKIFIKFANERPEALHYTASSVAIPAFVGAFPCEKQ